MGCIVSKITKDASNTDVLDYTSPGAEYDYLRPRGTIIIDMDDKWNIPLFSSILMVGLKMLFASGSKEYSARKFFNSGKNSSLFSYCQQY